MVGMGTNGLSHAGVSSSFPLPTVHLRICNSVSQPSTLLRLTTWCHRTAARTTMLYPETNHVPSQAEHRIKHDQPSELISKGQSFLSACMFSTLVTCVQVVVQIFEC